MTDYDALIDVIQKVGFPIFVALYHMVITTKVTQELTKAVEKLTIIIDARKE